MDEPSQPRLQIAFQGGGARIGALLAAAQGVYDAVNGKATLSTLSGTSAGAIAAAILATGRSPESFRNKLISIGPKYLPKICRSLSFLNPAVYKRVIAGDPLYDRKAYEDFIRELFEGEVLSAGIRLILPSVHLYGKDLLDSDVHNGDLVDRIVSSSAIPFVFHGWRSDSAYIDGGALNNLPVECLDPSPDAGRKLAVSFREKLPKSARSPFDYVSAIASCLIDYNVKQSSALISTDSVIQIDTELSTFDFAQSISYIQSSEYRNVVDIVKSRTASVITHEMMTHAYAKQTREQAQSDLAALMSDLQLAHASLRRQGHVNLRQKIVEYKCWNLFDRNTSRKDLVTFKEHIVSDSPILACGVTSMSDGSAIKGGKPDYEVKNGDNKLFSATAVGIPESIQGAISAQYANMMLFFDTPLPVDERGYSIIVRGHADEALYDLLNAGKRFDRIGFTCVEAASIERLYLICQIPTGMVSDLELLDDPSIYNSPPNWHSGKRMQPADFEELALELPDRGFARIGWIVENVVRGETAGFRALFRHV